MNAGWKTVKLGDVARYDKAQGIHSGLPYVGLEHIESGTRKFIGSRSDMEVYSSTFLFNPNHVLYGRLRPYLRKVLVPDFAGHCSTEIFPILPSDDLDRSYLSYWLITESTTGAIDRLCNGARMPRANMEQALELEIPLPPLAEQKRIVALLDDAFAGIDEAKAKAETNLGNAIGLFEMVREDSMREPEAQTTSYGFDEICKVDSVLVDPRESTNAAKLHVGGANIESKTGRLIALQTARQEGLKSGKFPFQEGMVLYSKIRPNLMKVARPDFDGLCSADMYPLAPVAGRVCRDYLYHLLLTERFTRFALLGSERAGMPKVNRDYLSRFTTKLPSINEQQALASKLDSLDQSLRLLRELLTNKLAALQELKSSLLSQAFAGELTA